MHLFEILQQFITCDGNDFANENVILNNIKKFIKDGGDINQDIYSENAIVLACEKGFVKIVYYLLINNLDKKKNYIDKDGISILIYACMYNHLEIVELLLRNDININYQDKKGKTAFNVCK